MGIKSEYITTLETKCFISPRIVTDELYIIMPIDSATQCKRLRYA